MKDILLKLLKWKLKLLAKLTVKKYEPGIVGVTGNTGKTSTREAIRLVLESERRVQAASPKNFNNELGLPLAVLGVSEDVGGPFFWLKVIGKALVRLIIKDKNYPEILVLEYGVERPGDMRYLLEIARPQVAVVTAIGKIPSHVEFFGSYEGLCREKSKMVNSVPSAGCVILNADDFMVKEMRNQTRARVITFGLSKGADVEVTNIKTAIDETGSASVSMKLEHDGSLIPFRLEDTLGKSQCYALAAAACVGLMFGVNLVKIADRLKEYKSPPGRLKGIRGKRDSIIIDDTYNAGPLAMEEALDVVKKLKAKRKIAILGDMLELGKFTIEAHESIGKIAAKTLNLLLTVGVRAKFIAEAAEKAGMPKSSILECNTLEEASKIITENIKTGDLVLVKGSQSVRMEKIVRQIMAEPMRAGELLVRQSARWEKIPGLYDNEE